MSIDPGPPKRSFIPLLLLLVGSVGVFVVGLGVTAFVTRDNSPQSALADAGPQFADAGAHQVDAGGARGSTVDTNRIVDAGGTPKNLVARDAGAPVSIDAGGVLDAGDSADAGGPGPSIDLDAMAEDLGATLAACIGVALRRDPGASTRARVRIKATGAGVVVVGVDSSASPYFRRCAIGATSTVAMASSEPQWLNVDTTAALTFVNDGPDSAR